MKLPAHLYLDGLGIPYEAREFPASTEKGAASVARVLGFPERQAVKTLVFQVDTGETVLVMLGGDQSAISGNLKKAIGSRNIRMAAPEVVKEATGYVIGSIPPFGWQPAEYRSFLERSLLNEPVLGVGAGAMGQRDHDNARGPGARHEGHRREPDGRGNAGFGHLIVQKWR